MPAGTEPASQGVARPAPATPGLVNLANALTVVRLALVPVVVVCLLAGGPAWRVAAFFAFGLASVTDLLDGQIARSRGLITDFGKIADPIADKALTGAALVTMSFLGWLPWWVTAVILVREVAVTGLRFWVIRRGWPRWPSPWSLALTTCCASGACAGRHWRAGSGNSHE